MDKEKKINKKALELTQEKLKEITGGGELIDDEWHDTAPVCPKCGRLMQPFTYAYGDPGEEIYLDFWICNLCETEAYKS